MLQNFFKSISYQHKAPLDPDFIPAHKFAVAYQDLTETEPSVELHFSLQRSPEQVLRFSLKVVDSEKYHDLTTLYLQRTIKFHLWSTGGYELKVAGSSKWGKILKDIFSETGPERFDALFMKRIYDQSFSVKAVEVSQLPPAQEQMRSIGGHLDGNRIGFDLGASDYKIAAVKNGEAVFTTEIRWDPVPQTDPNYHWKRILDGIELAASYLPSVDAIGGSSAGIINNNRIMVASLFRSVPLETFSREVTPIFENLQKKWNVPLIAINDGDVSALAGAMGLKEAGILGVAMGSSEAVGFINKEGKITGQLNELAFAPIDYNPQGAMDEWSQGVGVGVMYFSQQAVNRLALAAGWSFAEDMLLPERLKEVQEKANAGDEKALKIYETIGVYLGYTVPYYHQFYDFNKLMAFGRVMSGKGGDVIIETALSVLKSEYPELLDQIELCVPDEKFRRVGQAVAAASLPTINPGKVHGLS
ncbi:MAG: ROK family protein [Bdellovibrionales bacterium]|nr:ROK family protein [Bdellovibrionales bacterium]